MAKLSQPQKVVAFLKEHPKQKFSAREIATQLVKLYADEYAEKRQNPRFANDKAFISQIVAEIGAHKDSIEKQSQYIFWQDKPRPRVFWYDPNHNIELNAAIEDEDAANDEEEVTVITSLSLSEHDLYPILIGYLKSELKLYCQRIDERRSRNSRGSRGNHWLHPDIVAMQPIDKEWNDLVRSCLMQGAGQRVRLWSFEVKKTLNGSNIRKSFFQAVSNSSWANEGYLVTANISSSIIEQELRMLSALHGIGVILLDPENPSESEILLPAQSRIEVDWQSVNRLLLENDDFRDYVELVSTYLQTGRMRNRDWNKM